MYCRLNIKTIANIAMDIIDSSAAEKNTGNAALSDPLPAHDLYILGAGISVPEHLTLHTIDLMRACSKVYTNLSGTELERLPDELRGKCESLWHLYRNDRPRVENYRDVVDAVIDAAAVNRPVAWLTPGHPRIFDSVSEGLLSAGQARGWSVHVAPAISSLDTLLCEVGYDPAGGLLIHEATALVAEGISPLPSIGLLLLQPGAFGTDLAHLTAQFSGFDLTPLKEHLSRFYPPQQSCVFVRSATQAGETPRIFRVQLQDLTSAPYESVAGSTLFLPAVERDADGVRTPADALVQAGDIRSLISAVSANSSSSTIFPSLK